MRKLEICALGSMQVRVNQQPVLALETGKVGALLVYLAVEREQPHTRRALADLLWPDRSQSEALNSLRFALSNLRAALQDRQAAAPFLLVDRLNVQVNPAAVVWVDAVAFQQQADACETAHPGVAKLQAALTLYRGGFLQGFSFGDSQTFETWALRMREQLDRQHLRLLQLLAVAHEAAGNYPLAEETYRSILAVDAWDEETHRRLMRLLAASGQRSAALAQYEACRLVLKNELGVEPERETQLLFQHLHRQSYSGLSPVSSSGDVATIPLLAREREIARLNAFLARALNEQGSVVLVTGEAGSGKTTLLHAFASQALADHPDLLIVGGQCNAYAGIGQPYLPLIECVQMLAGGWDGLPWAAQFAASQFAPDVRMVLEESLPEVTRTLAEVAPALRDLFVGRIENVQHVSDAVPGRNMNDAAGNVMPRLETNILYEQYTRLLTRLSHQHPLVLILDDVQWIDADSAALLFHLVRRLATSRVLLLVSYRPGEVLHPTGNGEHPLLRLVTELQRQGGSIVVDLDQADENRFVSALLGQDPLIQPHRLDDAFRAALLRRTGGNPLFTIELLRGLQARGDVLCDADGVWVSSPSLDWDYLPERVEAAIAGRVARLPAQWRDWLATASVAGESFAVEVLARVHSVDASAMLHDLSGLENRMRGVWRMVQAEGVQWVGRQSLSMYHFRHILYQTYLYQQLDVVERSRRHAAVGFALEELCAGQPEERARRAAALARHFEAGGLPERAAAYHLEAGKQAVFLASTSAAVAHYRRGLALLADLPDSTERNRLEISLLLALGAPFLLASGWGGSERQEIIRRVIELLKTNDKAALRDAFFPALYLQADWLVSQNELSQAVQLGEQMLSLAEGLMGLPLVMACVSLGSSRMFQGDLVDARRHLEHALRLIESFEHPASIPLIGTDLECTCRALLATTLAMSGYVDQGQTQAVRALDRARHLKNRATMVVTMVMVSEVAVLGGNLAMLAGLAAELLQLGKAQGMTFFVAYGQAFEGIVQVFQAAEGSAQAVAGLEMIRQGMKLWETTGAHTGRGQWLARLAAACLRAGQVEAGLAVIANVLEQAKVRGIVGFVAEMYRLQGELLLRREPPEPAAAEAAFLRALEIARQRGIRAYELRAAISLAKFWQAERPAEARQLLEATCAGFTEGFETHDWQEAQAVLKCIQGAF